MDKTAKVGDVMTKNVITVSISDTLDTVARLFEEHDYDGLPVIDGENKLVGIVTAYDMIVQSSGMHLPTVINIMKRIAESEAERKDLEEHFARLKRIGAKEFMNPNPLSIKMDMNIEEAAQTFSQHHRVNPLCVVDDENNLVGVLSRYDVIKFFNVHYLEQFVQKVIPHTKPSGTTKSATEVDSVLKEVSREFLLVTRTKRLTWKFIAVAAFIAGVTATLIMVLRVVLK